MHKIASVRYPFDFSKSKSASNNKSPVDILSPAFTYA